MRQPSKDKKATQADDAPVVPSRSEILAALQSDQGRAGLQLEWVLDHCDTANGAEKW